MKNLVVLGIIASCIWLMYQYPHVMINPGELAAAHQDLNNKCLQCHEPFLGISNEKCIACHKPDEIGMDSSLAQNAKPDENSVLFHAKLGNQPCTDCHTDHKGIIPTIPLSTFTHEFLAESVRNNCKSCHGKPEDTLHKNIMAQCSRCHNTTGWKSNVKFDHELLTSFQNNNCESCHQKPVDSYHHLFKDNCSKCHSTASWKPANFDHSTYFVLDKDHNVSCSTCHKSNNFSIYTCYGCHEHSESKMIRKHREEGIFNITKCASCHKSADEHDIRRNPESGSEINQEDIKKVKKYINSGEHNGHEKNEKDGD